MRLKQRKLFRLREHANAATGIYGPLTFNLLNTGVWPVLFDEHAVSLGAAGPVQLTGQMAAGAAAPDAGGFAAIRTSEEGLDLAIPLLRVYYFLRRCSMFEVYTSLDCSGLTGNKDTIGKPSVCSIRRRGYVVFTTLMTTKSRAIAFTKSDSAF